jgi:FdhD protein
VATVRVAQVRAGRRAEVDDQVAVEAPLELRVDGKALTVIMRTPGEDEELARGFLFSEGVIDQLSDLTAIRRPERLTGDEVGNVLDLSLRPGTGAPRLERVFYASSSCGVCGKSSISSLAVRAPAVASALTLPLALALSLPDRLRAAQPRFDATGGLHGSALFTREGQLLAAREDVGRHNALDKLIGWALAGERLPLFDAVLAVSGRVGYEIAQKAIAGGVPVIVAVGAPTSLAIELAEQFGVTLCGFVRPGSLNVYSHPERITP